MGKAGGDSPEGRADPVERLLELYYEDAAIDGPKVLDFVEKVLAGRFGQVDGGALMTFLDRLEVIIAGNIETRLEEAPGQDQAAEEALEHIRGELDRARERVAEVGP